MKNWNIHRLLLLLWGSLIAPAVLCVPRSQAATLLVYNNNDTGPGSLRQALQDNVGLGGGNTIVFSNVVSGSITLASALSITANVTILGPGAKILAISGNNSVRVFNITSGAISISGLTIANGRTTQSGAGIYSSTAFSLLTIQSCVFSNNISSANTGGALYCANPGKILNSTFQANSAASGGGGAIFCQVGLSISNCTFVGNVASGTLGRGGAIFAFNGSGSTEIYGCTIVSNTAGLSSGGVIRFNPSVFVRNSVIARNTASTNPDTDGPFASQGYNLIGDAGTSTGWTGAGDQVGTADSPTNPLLSPLQDNGGPTPTMSPLPGSPAIDQGHSSGITTDQRGKPRPYDHPSLANAGGGDGSDIGAVELNPGTLMVTNVNDSGPGSLRQAIADASMVDDDAIRFAANVLGVIALTSGELAIGKIVTIAGPGPNLLTVSGNNLYRVFNILANGNATLSGLTIRNGRVVGPGVASEQNGVNACGGGIYVQGSLHLSNCILRSNSVVGGQGGSTDSGLGGTGGRGLGGAICSTGAVGLIDCVVSNNTALGGQGGPAGPGFAGSAGNALGGGICSLGVPFGLTRCTLSANVATGGQGGVAMSGGSDSNGGQGYGGALYTESLAYVDHTTFADSSAIGGPGGGGAGSGSGGGIYTSRFLSLFTCTIANNNATGSSFDFGGGIYDNGPVLAIFNSTIASNHAAYGGGMYFGGASLGNTILAGNSISVGGSGPDGIGTIQSMDYNLIENTNDCTIAGTTTHNILNQNPLLGPLADNGGPTRTMALLSGSPAIDKGRRFGATTDQRGGVRPFDRSAIANAAGGDGSDIGAFEVGSYLRLTGAQRAANDIRVSFTTDLGGSYAITRRDLVATGTWTTVATNVPGTGAIVTVTNVGAATLPKGFYRGQSVP